MSRGSTSPSRKAAAKAGTEADSQGTVTDSGAPKMLSFSLNHQSKGLGLIQ